MVMCMGVMYMYEFSGFSFFAFLPTQLMCFYNFIVYSSSVANK